MDRTKLLCLRMHIWVNCKKMKTIEARSVSSDEGSNDGGGLWEGVLGIAG